MLNDLQVFTKVQEKWIRKLKGNVNGNMLK